MEQIEDGFSRLPRTVAQQYVEIEANIMLRSAKGVLQADMSEMQLRSFMQLANDAIISANSRGEILFWNRGAHYMFGYTEEEILGQPIITLIPEQYHDVYTCSMARVVSAGLSALASQPLELVGLRKDGSEFPIELSISMWGTSDTTFFNSIIRDISRRKSVLEALHTSEERFRTIIANAPIVLFAMDSNGIITLSEGQGLEELGLKPGQTVGTSVFELYHDIPTIINYIKRALDGETVRATISMGGRMLDIQYAPAHDAEGYVSGITGVATDVTERVEAETALRTRQKRFEALTEQADLVLVLDVDGVYRYASPSHHRILGYTPNELVGTNVFDLIHPADMMRAQAALAGFIKPANHRHLADRLECRVRHANTSWVILECSGFNGLNEPDIGGLIINARDITERIRMEKQLVYQMQHDALTSLPNRALLLERIERAIQDAQHMQGEAALLVMDLNRFKEINDTFGHRYGDLLLQQVGARLCQTSPHLSTIARLSGDEFAILLPVANEISTRAHVDVMHANLEVPFSVGGVTLPVDVSVGAALYPMHGSDALTLLRHADVAMYAAKQAHKGYVLYNASYEQFSSRRLALTRDLRRALSAHQLLMYYQPKAEVKTDTIYSVEALVRWQHPTYGVVPPDQFIPLAEQTGLIGPLTLHVLEIAIQQCQRWRSTGLNLAVAVNLSAWDLRESALPEMIAALLEQYNVPTNLLRVELTESAAMVDADRALDVLKRLSALGIHISVDDYGTGYSSLTYLKRLPVDELKIDRSFIQHITDVETDATIVRSTIAMAHSLGLHVVAEGVEDLATWQLLDTFDCDIIQGYFLSRPVPAPDLESWLHTRKRIVYR